MTADPCLTSGMRRLSLLPVRHFHQKMLVATRKYSAAGPVVRRCLWLCVAFGGVRRGNRRRAHGCVVLPSTPWDCGQLWAGDDERVGDRGHRLSGRARPPFIGRPNRNGARPWASATPPWSSCRAGVKVRLPAPAVFSTRMQALSPRRYPPQLARPGHRQPPSEKLAGTNAVAAGDQRRAHGRRSVSTTIRTFPLERRHERS